MTSTIGRIYDEARNWGRGPWDDEEHAAALAVCARATSKADAVELLTMLGLLRKGGTP